METIKLPNPANPKHQFQVVFSDKHDKVLLVKTDYILALLLHDDVYVTPDGVFDLAEAKSFYDAITAAVERELTAGTCNEGTNRIAVDKETFVAMLCAGAIGIGELGNFDTDKPNPTSPDTLNISGVSACPTGKYPFFVDVSVCFGTPQEITDYAKHNKDMAYFSYLDVPGVRKVEDESMSMGMSILDPTDPTLAMEALSCTTIESSIAMRLKQVRQVINPAAAKNGIYAHTIGSPTMLSVLGWLAMSGYRGNFKGQFSRHCGLPNDDIVSIICYIAANRDKITDQQLFQIALDAMPALGKK